jgi:hypothetical protein
MKSLTTALILLAAVSIPAASAGEPRRQPKRQWEYQVLTKQKVLDLGKKDLGAGLNRLGDDGWELVAVDTDYIFKRPRDDDRRRVAELKVKVAMLESDVEDLKDRVGWTTKMVRKGFAPANELRGVKAALEVAEAALERARRELQASQPDPAKPADKTPPRTK